MKAFRVDLRCIGKSMKSQLCSVERKNWLKPVTVQRALRPTKNRTRKYVSVSSMSKICRGQKRSYRGMLWHRDGNARAECGCSVLVRCVCAKVGERRKQSDDVGTRRVQTVCEWNGRYCSISIVCELWQISGSMTQRTHGSTTEVVLHLNLLIQLCAPFWLKVHCSRVCRVLVCEFSFGVR